MNDTNRPHASLVASHPLDQPLLALDGADVRVLFETARDWLAHHRGVVNRLNVFPVPDGDTGDNLFLTMKSACLALQSHPADHAGAALNNAAVGARHGSRGNSGVILGQILHGMAQRLADRPMLTATDLAAGWVQGSSLAYASVPNPVEGTILTAVAAIATAALAATAATPEDVENEHDIRSLFAAIVQAAHEAVERTPDLLPILAETGVVDSGAKGLFFIVEGMQRCLLGLAAPQNSDAEWVEAINSDIDRQFDKGQRALPAVRWGFDVQFLIERPAKAVDAILADISAMGDYALVEGDSRLVKVHVHVFDPGVPLSYAVQTGFVTDVVVENMDDGAANADIGGTQAADGIGIVAVAPSAGFARIFRDLGAHSIILGGQSMNPRTAELAAAVRGLPHQQVIVLPNNGNILLAAEQAADMTSDQHRQVVVAPVRTLPQGVAALVGLPAQSRELASALAAIIDHAGHVQTGEITLATRDLPDHALQLVAGDLVGLLEGKLAVTGQTIDAVALELLEAMNAADSEIITFYYGEGITESDAENLAEIVAYGYPEQDIEVASGGQPHYFYILSVE